VEQRISFVTLGVRDLDAARTFYGELGWKPALEVEETAFYDANGLVFALWGREKLAEDNLVEDGGGWGGVGLAYNVGSNTEVDAVIAAARAAGASISREPGERPWGGYSGVFVDPDGHPWEIAHNPGMPLSPDGAQSVPRG
jgi:catechol 2,3-dioxygenase-like lactoylglutathione lyase family enzyme